MASSAITAQGIQFFEGSFKEAQAKAKKENKHIFVDAYAVWCGPCKYLAKEVFPLKEVGDAFNPHFVSIKIDVEKGDGIAFAEKYEVIAMPTLFYFSADGELIHKTLGGSDEEVLIANSKQALNPDAQLYSRLTKFNKGEKTPEFLSQLCLDLVNVSDIKNANDVFNVIWLPLSLEQRTNPDVFDLARYVANSYTSTVFQYIADNKTAFAKAQPAGYVDDYIKEVFGASVSNIGFDANSTPEKEFANFNQAVKKYLPAQSKYYAVKLNYYYYNNKDAKSKEACKYKDEYLNKYADNSNELNEAAWEIVGTGQTKKDFEKGLTWAERSIKLDKNYANLDTKAWLLFKLNRNKEAITTAKEAIKLSAELDVDMTGTQQLIDEINSAK